MYNFISFDVVSISCTVQFLFFWLLYPLIYLRLSFLLFYFLQEVTELISSLLYNPGIFFSSFTCQFLFLSFQVPVFLFFAPKSHKCTGPKFCLSSTKMETTKTLACVRKKIVNISKSSRIQNFTTNIQQQEISTMQKFNNTKHNAVSKKNPNRLHSKWFSVDFFYCSEEVKTNGTDKDKQNNTMGK